MCGSENLKEWLDLGHQPHSDQFKKSKDEAEQTYPLRVSVCEDCGLNQLSFVVAKEELYLKDYLYESSITRTANEHWTEFAETVSQKIDLKENSLVVDIGSNDGTLLTKFQALGHQVLGIDPTPEATQIAIDRGVPTIQEFFNGRARGKAEEIFGKPNLIVGTNVFAHIHDLQDFFMEIMEFLKEDGVFVFESPYFGEFLKGMEYDTVYHQHLSYLSLKPVKKFVEAYGYEVFDVEERPLHGGVFRVYIARKGERTLSPNVAVMLANETWEMASLEGFAARVKKLREELVTLILDLKLEGKSIAVVSTPAKGNTLLNYTGIGRYIDFATDKSKLKQGRFTPGTFIEVLSDEELVKRQPDFALILAWNFFPEICENVRKAGFKGKFIRPLPEVQVYE